MMHRMDNDLIRSTKETSDKCINMIKERTSKKEFKENVNFLLSEIRHLGS